MLKSKLAHVCIETSDLEGTEAFYRALGLERRFEFRNAESELVGFYLAFADRTYIEVIKVASSRTDGVIRHFAIEVEDVDSAYQQLCSAGIDVSAKKLANDHTWMITCKDPNGIFIELQQYTVNSMQLAGGICQVNYRP
jgi:catechol 2,3-dioxygenase-like lactoylglutathione lyase family enzyme